MHQMTTLLAENESVTGSQVVGLNQQRLQALEHSLSLNEESMTDLDGRVKQMREMVGDRRHCRKHQLAASIECRPSKQREQVNKAEALP